MSAPFWSKCLSYSAIVANGNSGAAPAIDWAAGQFQSITLTANATATFAPPPAGTSLYLLITQDGAGGRSFTPPASVKWIGGVPGLLNVAPGGVSALKLFFDGSSYWAEISGASLAEIPAATPLAAGGTANLNQVTLNNIEADSTGAQSTMQLPAAPANGDVVILKLVGANVANPVLIQARGGAAVEDPSTPGTFSAANGSVAANEPGQTMWFQYQAIRNRWTEIV